MCSTMPENIRVNLMHDLNTIYKKGVYDKDTRSEGERNDFQAIHFSYYNRYCTRVCFFFFFLVNDSLHLLIFKHREITHQQTWSL